MLEKRKNPRLRTLKAGLIAIDSGTISCVIRNISITGACPEVASSIGIPNEFTLMIENDDIRQPWRVAWMKDRRIGILFV
jgi:hypothetical protein